MLKTLVTDVLKAGFFDFFLEQPVDLVVYKSSRPHLI